MRAQERYAHRMQEPQQDTGPLLRDRAFLWAAIPRALLLLLGGWGGGIALLHGLTFRRIGKDVLGVLLGFLFAAAFGAIRLLPGEARFFSTGSRVNETEDDMRRDALVLTLLLLPMLGALGGMLADGTGRLRKATFCWALGVLAVCEVLAVLIRRNPFQQEWLLTTGRDWEWIPLLLMPALAAVGMLALG